MIFNKISLGYGLLLLPMALASSCWLPAQANSVQAAMSEIVNGDDLVGLAVAIVRQGEAVSLQTYGVTEVGGEATITADTTFRIASLSKAFAATVAVQLELEEKLSLDEPIISYNRDFRLKNQTQAEYATLNHVLSHRLSLPPYAYDNLLESGLAPKKILRKMSNVEAICKVGSCYAYQNVGFNMIASAIEVADQQPYAAAVGTRLFEPLDMRGASFGKDNLMASGNWARSYKRLKGDTWKAVPVKQAYYAVPAAGGVNANIRDMAKWLDAQMGNSPAVLSNATLRRLHTPQTKTKGELRRMKHLRHATQAYYGLGWRVYTYAGATIVNHSGSVEGYGAQIAFIPEKKVGIVLLTNSISKQFWQILPKFLDQELGLLPL